MEDFLKKISQIFNFTKNPRIKFLGIFLMIFSFVGETILRKLSHSWAEKILTLIGGEILIPGTLIEKIFSIGAPIIIVYIPITIFIWIIIKDGLQKIDWLVVPILIGILIKASVYGILSFRYRYGEFWQLTQNDVSGTLLWFFIFLFLFSGLIGLLIWFKEIS